MGLFDFLSAKDRSLRKRRAAALYAVAVAQARQPALYTALAAPDTLEGRFELITLHVHLVCRRLGKAGGEGAALAQDVFDAMFRDMDRNLRELGVGDPAIARRMKALIEAYYGRINAYEGALAAGGDALAAAIARNVYNTDVVSPAASALAAYARRAAQIVNLTDARTLMNGGVEFPPIVASAAARAERSLK